MKKLSILYVLMFFSLHIFGQANSSVIFGKVTALSNGETLMGVSVVEIDESNRVINGTVTDFDGNYSLRIKSAKNKIKFSYIGFINETISTNTKTTLNIKLREETQNLRETVVTARRMVNDGAMNIKPREISMAMQMISTKDMEGLSVASVDDALQGRVSGLDIVGNSGAPGAGTSMTIRGRSSITGSGTPLIVVNGIPFDGDIKSDFDFASANEDQYANLLNVNVDDIEDITVLKDAASTSIWGSKGANGVLMIRTKKGTIGKTRVQYSYRFTNATQPKGMQMLNGDDYTMLMKQAYFNKSKGLTETVLDFPEFNYDPSFVEYENFNNNTDWVAAVSQNGITNDHYLTISGGGERARFRISGGYYDQTGTNIGQHLKRLSTRSQLEYQVSDRLRFTSEFSYTFTDNNKNYISKEVGLKESLLAIAYKKMPNVSIYAQDANGINSGNYYNIKSSSQLDSDQKNLMNPVALANLATNNEKGYRILPTFRLLYDFFNPEDIYLRYNAYVAFDINNLISTSYLPYNVNDYTWNNNTINRAESDNIEKIIVMTENNITWQLPRNDTHQLMLYGAIQTSSSVSTTQAFSTYGLPDNMINDATSIGYLAGQSTETSKSKSIGFLSRAHYSVFDRYILDLSYRVDGSTKFGANNRFGAFPGVGAKWIISDEPFMKSNDLITLLAIRPSWGISGNQPSAEYLQYSKYVADSYGYMNLTSIHPDNLQLSNLRWEKTSSSNIGADIELNNGNMSLTLDYYHKRTDDLLFSNLSISPTSGYTSIKYNNVGVMNNDGWEVNLDFKNLLKINKFSMDVNFNISNFYNTIVEMDDVVLNVYNEKASSIGNGTYLTRLQENNSFGSIYGFKNLGVYQYSDYIAGEQEDAPVVRDDAGNVMLDFNGDPKQMYYKYKSTKYAFKGGDTKYEDVNKDGSIDEYDLVYLGNSNPKFNGGFSLNFRYGQLSMRSLFAFRYGNKVINAARMYAENMYGNDNQTITTNWRWRKEGDITPVPRAAYQEGYNWLGSDRYVEDGSYLKLKYLTFNYSMPTQLVKKASLNQVSFYMTFNNLFTLTNYSGVDPEISQGRFTSNEIPGVSKDVSKTPRSKDWNFGVTIGF